MYRQSYLQIPGPTNIPEPILSAMHRPAINHRGRDFASLLDFCVKGLQEIFQTRNTILLFPGSGSGGLEAAIVNTLSPGDKVLALDEGVFSRRFGEIAQTFGAEVSSLKVAPGEAVSPQRIAEVLEADKRFELKALLLTHNETATGVTLDLAGVRAVLDRLNHPALMLVDAVSSLAITPLNTDELRADVVVSASQKGLMLHAGFTVLTVSEKAWQASALMPRWFWDFRRVKKSMDSGQMPYTPPIALFFGLEKAIEMLREEGLENVFRRHAVNAQAVRAALEAIGLELLVQERSACSNAVTAVKLPQGLKFTDLTRACGERGLVIGGGLQELEGTLFRIGHMGMLHEPEVYAIMGALEAALEEGGFALKTGEALKAAALTYQNQRRSER